MSESVEGGEPVERVEAFVGAGAFFEGKLSFGDTVRIDGHVRGEVRGDGTLIVGETGVVEGEIAVGTLVVQGRVTGPVSAKDRIEIHATASVEGSVSTPRLRLDEGARLDAKIEMGEAVS